MSTLLISTLLIVAAPVVPAPHVRHYERLARAYFSAWNSHQAARLSDLLAEGCSLRDWNVQAAGREAVVEANVGIWKAVSRISIDVLSIHVADATRTAVCEILVHLHNDAKEVLKVADVITFDEQDKIISVRAYKG